MENARKQGRSVVAFEDSPVAKVLFGDVRFAWIWLILRLYVGYEWITAGWEKLNSPAWTGAKAGSAMTGFVKGALAQTGGAHPAVQGWYASFLQSAVLPAPVVWSWAISIGEFLVGLGLIVGMLTGIAAFFGSVMNMNYLLAGAVR